MNPGNRCRSTENGTGDVAGTHGNALQPKKDVTPTRMDGTRKQCCHKLVTGWTDATGFHTQTPRITKFRETEHRKAVTVGGAGEYRMGTESCDEKFWPPTL